ncbi:MAG: RsmD family RNA methyltransferase [Anaerolineae bacterium]
MMDDSLFEIKLESMAHGGSALGHHGQQVVFVPYTIPGERVQARVVSQKGRALFAQGVTLLEASADRVFPACPHFGPGQCGACHWQHISYEAQLLLKQDVLADQLERIGGLEDAQVFPVIPCPEVWGYNHHMTLQTGKDGQLGFAAANHAVYPVSICHVLHPDLLEIKAALDIEQIAGLESLTLQRSTDGSCMAIMQMTNDEAPELELDFPLSINLRLADGETANLLGDYFSTYQIGGRAFRVTAGCFIRPNLSQMDNLIGTVMHALALTGRENVLELYAGVGVFTAFIAPQASAVTLVEDDSRAVDDADLNLADYGNIDIVEGLVEDVLPELDSAASFDVALLDPDEDGLSVAVVDSLAALAIPRLVYVSSNPATLARDAKRLRAHGYHFSSAQPLDLAPQTYQIDTVAVLQR